MNVYIFVDSQDRPVKVFATMEDAKEYMARYNAQFPARAGHIEPHYVNYGQVM